MLSDNNLIEEYKNSKSLQKNINKLIMILVKNDVLLKQQENIINDFILELIPPEAKCVIRGNKFNKIIKDYIKNIKILNDNDRFDIEFEKKT